MFIDTHCHLYDEYYDDFDNLVSKIEDSKISKVINNGCDNSTNIEVLDKIKIYDFMYGALGIHPESADSYTLDDLKFIENHIQKEVVE